MRAGESQMPEGWHLLPAEQVGTVQLGRQRSPKKRSAHFPTKYLRAANITEAGLDLTDVLEMEFEPEERRRYQLAPDDIVLSEASGSPSQVGKPAIWNDELPLCCFQNTVIRFRPREADSRYILWLFTHFYRNGVFAQVAGGVGINHLGAKKFSQLLLPIPTLDEQRQIVAEIEKQLTRLDVAVAALRRVQAQLKRYRAAVLKAACEGRLVRTEAELATERGLTFESAARLLKRIEETDRAAAKSKARRNQTPERDLPSAAESVPEGWAWATWAQVGEAQNGRPFPSSEYRQSGVKLLRPGNLHESGNVVWASDNTKCLPEEWAERNPDLLVHGGELVMNLTAQSLRDEFLGRVCMTEPTERCLLNQRLARLRPCLILPRFVLFTLKSWRFRRFVDRLNTGSLIQHMFTSQLAGFEFPLPPLAEQHRIVADVERRFSVIQELEAAVATNLQRAARLRQSILDRAFRGELVRDATTA